VRRFLGASVCLALLAGAAPSSARLDRAPQAWAGSYQVAEAGWIVRRGDRYTMYVVFAENVSGPRPKAHTAVFLGKGPCRVRAGRSRKSASCSVRGRFRRIAADAFEFDASLSRADLSLPGVRVRWSDPGNPVPDHNLYMDGPFVDFEAELKRPALAAGRVLGVRMTKAELSFARLAHGLFAGGDHSAVPDGPLEIRVRVAL
jgi:hypothetical protein